MPTSPTGGGRGVVQWVIPPQAKPKKGITRSSTNGHIIPQNTNITDTDSNSHDENITHLQEDGQIQSQTNTKPVIDMSICRTICIFVDQHLKELQMHQQMIDKARSRLVFDNLHNSPDLLDSTFIARNDLSKLKVRDEQTKAIETIKQLTNYLKELAYLQRLCDSANQSIDEETLSKLSDIRSDIIQALNDFVLSNYDIDVPIIDPEDFASNGYDLCADAGVSLRHDRIDKEPTSPENGLKRTSSQGKPSFESSSLDVIEQSNEQYLIQSVSHLDQKFENCNMRQREIQKIEKDTVALRQLFSEFYNLVKAQGEQVDLIEDNIVITTHRISDGHRNINKSVNGLTILVSATGCMAGALIGGPIGIVLGGKLGCITIGFASSLLGLLSSYTAQRRLGCIKKDD